MQAVTLSSSKPIKFVHLQRITNQSMLNSGMTSTDFFMKAGKSLVVQYIKKRFTRTGKNEGWKIYFKVLDFV